MTQPEFTDLNSGIRTPEKTIADGDPLLGSDDYIDPVRVESGGVFTPGVAIDAKPISMYDPQEMSRKSATKSSKRRNTEEMAVRPTWLPDDWKIDMKVRASGVTKGHIDRYYVEPTGNRRFRSKIEVIHFLETGSSVKRKPTSYADDKTSATPGSQSRKKSREKSEN